MILLGIFNLILGYGTWQVYDDYGINGLFYFMIIVSLGIPFFTVLYSFSQIYIENDLIIKRSIFRTKKNKLSDVFSP